MSAIAIQAMLSAAAPAPAGVSAGADTARDTGFSALLGKMTDPKASAAPRSEPAKPKGAADSVAEDAETSTQSALQSLEAALTGFVAPAPAKPPAATAQDGAAAKQSSAPLNSALAAAAGALDNNAGGLWDGSGRTPLKAMLQADPSLGLTDFQVKTFLAAAGATPMRAAGTPLAPGSAWSPLAAAAKADVSGSPGEAAPSPIAAPPAPVAQAAAQQPATSGAMISALASSLNGEGRLSPRGVSPAANPSNGASSVAAIGASGKSSAARPLAARASRDETSPPAPNAAGSAAAGGASALEGPLGGGARRNGAPATAPDAAAASAAVASADAASTPTFTVPLANLPTFIAEQASALASGGPSDTPDPATAASTSATPKAAQAVKELTIALDPADLGEMTLKLRLAGGKLSITIGVANSQTLAAIEDDRALIAARLATGGQGLEDLIIQRQTAASPTPDTGQAHGFANDSGSQSSSSQGEPKAQDRSDRGARAAARRDSGADGSFGDLLV